MALAEAHIIDPAKVLLIVTGLFRQHHIQRLLVLPILQYCTHIRSPTNLADVKKTKKVHTFPDAEEIPHCRMTSQRTD